MPKNKTHPHALLQTDFFFLLSCRFLHHKKVRIDLIAPYSLIPVYKGLAADTQLEKNENKTAGEVKNKTLAVWTRLLMDARTFFEQGHV